MIYLNDETVNRLNTSWHNNIRVIGDAAECILHGQMAQPIKPYLRYGDSRNRIIAMPAYVGGNINKAGIKWIASFPENIHHGLARAHSVTILNEADTGVPAGIINSGSLSAIRTASVSGFLIKKYMEQRKPGKVKIGIIGFGPIGRYHLDMCHALLGNSIGEVLLYDLRPIPEALIPGQLKEKVTITATWAEAYAHADIFMTCTVAKERYIDQQPKAGALCLNVSLRDFKPDVFPWFANAIIVDNWEEVCREHTDIEMFHKLKGLEKSGVKEIQDILDDAYFATIDPAQPVMFNPMGMAVFDIAIADHFVKSAAEAHVGFLPGEAVLSAS